MGLVILMERRVADGRKNREKCSSTFSGMEVAGKRENQRKRSSIFNGIEKSKPLDETSNFDGMESRLRKFFVR